jgi:hypothetical protein
MARDDASADLEQLKTWGAPAAVQAMAQLRAVSAPRGQASARSGQRSEFLESLPVGAPVASNTLRALDKALPRAFRSIQARRQVKPERTVATVERTVEGITPWMQSPVSFSAALRIADHPCKWVKATSQMRSPSAPEILPANGALWRALLTKQTDFGKPLVSDLVSTETIHITAEGSTADDGLSGDRRYTYHLVATESGEGMMSLVRDEGWIELRGDRNGTRLRICKRATVLRPVVDPFGALLSIGFSTELWLWASGFFSAAQPARGRGRFRHVLRQDRRQPASSPAARRLRSRANRSRWSCWVEVRPDWPAPGCCRIRRIRRPTSRHGPARMTRPSR